MSTSWREVQAASIDRDKLLAYLLSKGWKHHEDIVRESVKLQAVYHLQADDKELSDEDNYYEVCVMLRETRDYTRRMQEVLDTLEIVENRSRDDIEHDIMGEPKPVWLTTPPTQPGWYWLDRGVDKPWRYAAYADAHGIDFTPTIARVTWCRVPHLPGYLFAETFVNKDDATIYNPKTGIAHLGDTVAFPGVRWLRIDAPKPHIIGSES